MKKRQLFSLIITALLLCTLLPTLAFAVADNPSGTTLAELKSGETMENNNGTITVNNGTVTNNNGIISDNNRTVTNNNGTIGDANTYNNNYNRGLVVNNYGTVHSITTAATITNNYGNAYHNMNGGVLRGIVENNFAPGQVVNITVANNYGSAGADDKYVTCQYLEVKVTGDEHTTNTLHRANNKLWIADNTKGLSVAGEAVFTPDSGYKITAATASDGTMTQNADGTWKLSAVKNVYYADTVDVALTVTTATATPKTGVDRDTGILTALALVSGIILVTALPKKKTGVK